MSRALSKAISRLLIGVFLFAQFAVAGYACPGLSGMTSVPKGNDLTVMARTAAPGDAIAAKSTDMTPGCDQIDQGAANLCTEHCRFGQQSADTAPLPVVLAAIPTFSVFASPRTGTLARFRPVAPDRRLQRGSGASAPARHPALRLSHLIFRRCVR